MQFSKLNFDAEFERFKIDFQLLGGIIENVNLYRTNSGLGFFAVDKSCQ